MAKRVGRPPKAESERCNEHCNTYLTEAEICALEKQAQEQRLSLSAIVGTAALRGLPKGHDPERGVECRWHRVSVNLTTAEAKAVREAAAKHSLSMSAYMAECWKAHRTR